MDFGEAIVSSGLEAIEDVISHGYHMLGEVVDPAAAGSTTSPSIW